MSGVRIAASLGFGVALAAMVASAGLSRQALAADNAEIPAALRGVQGDALELGAEIALERGEPASAEALARDALQHSLGHVAALRVLAQTAQARGDTEATARYMSLAGRWSWRDTPTQGWLFDQAVGRRDFRSAMDHADAILRMREIEHEMFGVLRYAGEDADFRRALTAKLLARPSWRGSFFRDAAQSTPDQRPGLEATIRDLRSTSAPINPAELSSYAASLVVSGEIPRAAILWTRQFGGNPDTGFILDWPSETRVRQRLPFDWWIASTRGVSAVPGNADNAPLSLAADRGALGSVAVRLFALPAGRYRISLAGTQPAVTARRALRWTIQCRGGLTVEASAEGDSWSVTVPQSCPVQTLRLGVDNDDVRFEALLGSVRLQRVGGETSAITG
jgi:hypothetical protein